MPALPKLRTPALVELARQLRFESAEAARRQLERTETFALEVLSECGVPGSAAAARAGDKSYPLEYVVFRITGLRPEGRGEGAMLVGAPLLGDLAVLIERLSSAAGVTISELAAEDGGWIGLDALQKRWGVGRKTIERERRRGLFSRRAAEPGAAMARARVMVSERAIEAFEAAGGRAMTLRQAREQRRANISVEDREELAREAARQRIEFGYSLNGCARAMEGWGGYTSQTIARALRKHEDAAANPIFGRRKLLSDRARTRIGKAARQGASPAQLARRGGRSRGTAYRIAADERLSLLKTLNLDGPVGSLFEREDAEEVLLSPAPVRERLGEAAPGTVGQTVALAEAMDAPEAGAEAARAVAMLLLRFRVRTWLEKTTGRGGVRMADLHAAETRLLWASRLKAELVRSQLPVAMRTARARLGGRDPGSLPARPPRNMPTMCGSSFIAMVVQGMIEATERFDPLRGGRLAAATTVSVNRAVGAWMTLNMVEESPSARRATAMPVSAGEPVGDWSRRVDRWQKWLEPSPIAAAWAKGISGPGADLGKGTDRMRRVLVMRFGLNGAPPRTPRDVALELGTTPARVSALERAAIEHAIAHGKSLMRGPGG